MNDTERANELAALNNDMIMEPVALVLAEEERFRAEVRALAGRVLEGQTARADAHRIVLLSGPTASGKTTAAAMLIQALEEMGSAGTRISLDNFYLGRESTPLLPDGTYDYESVHALDLEQLRACFDDLAHRGECDMPRFDFPRGAQAQEKIHLRLRAGEAVLVEGIHALNPLLTENLPTRDTLRAYIHVAHGFGGETPLLSARDVRLIRRVVRDYCFRGASPLETLSMWPGILRGEEEYIAPFRGDVDYTVDSLHRYEPCLMRNKALELLSDVPEDSGHVPLAARLCAALQAFEPIPSEFVPKDSLLREFIGGGIYG